MFCYISPCWGYSVKVALKVYIGYTAHKLYGYRLEIVLENVPDCFPSLEFPETEHLTAFACKCTN